MSSGPNEPNSSDPKDLVNSWNLGNDSEFRDPSDSELAAERTATPETPDQPDDLLEVSEADFIIQSSAEPLSLNATRDFLIDTVGVTPAHIDETGIRDALPKPQAQLIFPKIGSRIGGFHLRYELGRGAFGRVYMAIQEDLGDRKVAVKVSQPEGDEPHILAKLQHTYIMPIHSVVDDKETGLRLMCMPYYGGANLARILSEAGAKVQNQATGRTFVEALDLAAFNPTIDENAAPGFSSNVPTNVKLSGTAQSIPSPHFSRQSFGLPIPTFKSIWTRHSSHGRATGTAPEPEILAPEPDDRLQPARQYLRKSSYIRASVWIIARLAEGLEHAHSRGLLHRDLKPSNILITADGTPMLLDFNLSTEVRASTEEDGRRAMLGGTLPYMAPEHLDAFNPQGTTPASEVNERADIYALGLILFEMIARRPPFAGPTPGKRPQEVVDEMTAERRKPAPSLRVANPEVPFSLDAIVTKSLDPDASKRYQSAADFAEDLRRFLADHPNRHAPEPSVRERCGKFLRRNPRIASSGFVSSIAAVVIVLMTTVIAANSIKKSRVEARLELRAFQDDFQDCQLRLNTSGGPIENLQGGIELAKKTLGRYGVSPEGTWIENRKMESLTNEEQRELKSQLAELVLLDCRARLTLATRLGNETDRAKALKMGIKRLDVAESHDPAPPAALFTDRARYESALGLALPAAQDRKKAASTKVGSARDLYLLGTSLLSQGKSLEAGELLERAVALEPKRFWAWFALGHCRFEAKRYLEASGDFAACTALAPNFAWPYLNRGLALARAGRLLEAEQCYDLAISKSPKFAEAFFDRGLVRLELNKHTESLADLETAVLLGRKEPEVRQAIGAVLERLNRGEEACRIYDRLIEERPNDPTLLVARGLLKLKNDPTAGRADLERVVELEPGFARAHYGLAMALRKDSPKRALEHASQAFESDRNILDALQLRALLKARLDDLSAIDDVELLIQAPTANRLYNGACTLALLAESRDDAALAEKSIRLLERALRAGFPIDEVKNDPDLKYLRRRKDYIALTAAGKAAIEP